MTANAHLLIVDDEPDIRALLKDILEDEGYQVDVAEHARAANDIRATSHLDLVLLDIWMPGIDGVTLLKEWKADRRDTCPIVMMSGHGTVETAVEATRHGAYDFVEKPLSMTKLLSTVKAALHSANEVKVEVSTEEPVGNSEQIRAVRQQMQALKNTNIPVFLSGTDCEERKLWATYLSRLADRKTVMRDFDQEANLSQYLPLSCNLYIKEISDLHQSGQSRFLQLVNCKRVTDRYRIIAASRYTDAQLFDLGRVSPEIAVFWCNAIKIPSLDERIEDIPELLKYYVNWYAKHEKLPYRHFGVAAQNLLRHHHWQGGISQLKQFIKTVLTHRQDENVELDELSLLLKDQAIDQPSNSANTLSLSIDLNLHLREAREMFERAYLSRQLQLCGNNMTELAKCVGQERTHLYRKLKSLGLYTKK